MGPRVKELIEAAKQARFPLGYASEQFNNSNFTDRHGMGPVCSRAYFRLDRALAAFTDDPARDHRECLARRIAEDDRP